MGLASSPQPSTSYKLAYQGPETDWEAKYERQVQSRIASFAEEIQARRVQGEPQAHKSALAFTKGGETAVPDPEPSPAFSGGGFLSIASDDVVDEIAEFERQEEESRILDWLEANPNPDFTALDTFIHDQLTECLAEPGVNQQDCFEEFDNLKAFYAKVQDYLSRNTQ